MIIMVIITLKLWQNVDLRYYSDYDLMIRNVTN